VELKDTRLLGKNVLTAVLFVFKIHKNAAYDVGGDALYYPEENVVRCKVCMSTFKYESKPKG